MKQRKKKQTITKESIIALIDEIGIIVAAILIVLYMLYRENLLSIENLLIIASITILASIFVSYKIIETYRKPPAIGEEELIGKKGLVIEDLDPEGKILIEGEIWRARSISGHIRADKEVIVRGVEGLTLIVEEIQNE
ncbi:MAG: hypothetical protein F7C36_04920 [Desulfurococcales archaeon]|nr:hypothetical protein [Desulfurococcales archaeon]